MMFGTICTFKQPCFFYVIGSFANKTYLVVTYHYLVSHCIHAQTFRLRRSVHYYDLLCLFLLRYHAQWSAIVPLYKTLPQVLPIDNEIILNVT